MSNLLTIRTIRVAANVFEFDKSLTDTNTSASPASWRANPLRIEVGVFERTSGEPMDLADIARIRVCAKKEKTTAAEFIFDEAVAVSTNLITREDWTAGSAFNAAVNISALELDLAPESRADSVELYMTITAYTTDEQEITLEAGTLVIHEDINAASFTGLTGNDADGEEMQDASGETMNFQPED